MRDSIGFGQITGIVLGIVLFAVVITMLTAGLTSRVRAADNRPLTVHASK
jgi:hypothetical protein